METDFLSFFFFSSSRVCVGTEGEPNEKGLWGGMEPVRVPAAPPPAGWTLMATLASSQLRPACLSVYSYSSPGHNLR